jgi:hypothetical protein
MAWFLLDATHADYKKAAERCRIAHEKNAPGCLFSINVNADKTRAIAKVARVGKAWLASGAVLDRCDTMEEHKRLVAMVNDRAWSTPSKIGGNISVAF